MTAASWTQTKVSEAQVERRTEESRVDRDSHFNGLFETKQNLRIEGIAEGEIRCDGTMTVAEGAQVKAKVTASTVTIAGELEGEVVCQGTFQIMPSGQVKATVSARRIVVHEGGFYNGEFHMIVDDTGSAVDPLSALRAPAGEAFPEPATRLQTTEEWWAKLTSTPPEPDETNGTSG